MHDFFSTLTSEMAPESQTFLSHEIRINFKLSANRIVRSLSVQILCLYISVQASAMKPHLMTTKYKAFQKFHFTEDKNAIK